jgi:hypothetical protein
MSQNPNGPNYNPYGPNPSNPNYPNPGTAYGGPQQPPVPNSGYPSYPSPNQPSGANPNVPNPGYPSYPSPNQPPGTNPNTPNAGYPPYPSPNPPLGANPNTPNTPNSSYGSYGSPYAPPPNTYGNAPTPPPPVTGPNPYDPYGPTSMSQQVSSPGYPTYSPVSGPGPMLEQPLLTPPQSAPQKKSQAGVIVIVVIALIVLIGGGAFGFVAYTNNQNTLHISGTATAVAVNNAHLTATAQVYATATAVASTYPFSDKLVLNDPMVDNSKGSNWDNDKTTGCYFDASAYHVVIDQANQYNTCAALGTDYTNFTFETDMVIKSGGDGASGGLLFRADENNNKYYRLSIDSNGDYFILAIVDNTGTGSNGNARTMKQGTASSFETGESQSNTLAIVANGDQYSFYVNKQLVTTFTDSSYTHGQIGFDVDYGTTTTELLFTNTKVWQLPS